MNARTSRAILIAPLFLAACGSEPRAEAPDAAPPATTPPAAPAPDARPAPPPPAGTAPPPPPPVANAPTAADSAAARAEDVSPEWKQRSRMGESYASCMEKTTNAPESARPPLVAACGRLPDAPKK